MLFLASLGSYIGGGGLLLLTLFIVALFVRRRKIEKALRAFYPKHGLTLASPVPAHLKAALGNANWQYLTGRLPHGLEFYWCEGYTSSTVTVNNTPQTSLSPLLAVAFAPGTVSAEFIREAQALATRPAQGFGQRLKYFFVRNMETPYRAEKLADGSFLLCWHVLWRADIYEAKIDWLRRNATRRDN